MISGASRPIASRLRNAAARIGREINPVVYTTDEFTDRFRKRDHLAQAVMRSPKIFVIGDEHELGTLAR